MSKETTPSHQNPPSNTAGIGSRGTKHDDARRGVGQRSTIERLGQFQPGVSHPTTFLSRYQSILPIVIVGFAVLSVFFGVVINLFIQSSMENLTRQSLENILLANVRVLKTWMNDQELVALDAAQAPQIQAAAAQLIETSSSKFQWQPSHLRDQESFTLLQNRLSEDPRYLGWCIVRFDDLVVASNHIDLVGKPLPIRQSAIDRLQRLEPAICHTIPLPIPVTTQGPLSVAGGPVMATMAPIVRDHRSVGALALLIDPLDQFTELMSIANWGSSGESYAFDDQARLLSKSRFELQLRGENLLPVDPQISSALSVSLRAPIKDFSSRGDSGGERAELPLTLMADEAIRGGSGENMDGYDNYRGVEVVGAWTWIPEQNIGVATELSVSEAYRPLRLFKRLFVILLSITAIASIALLLMVFWNRRVTQRLSAQSDPSRHLGQYELGEILGRGGMGSVFQASHHTLRRPVAIKVLEADKSSSSTVARFEREVQMTAGLKHPNTIKIYDFGRTDKGTFFYVMEYVDGISLQELVDDFGSQPPGRVIHLLLQICGALSEAHHKGLIHRDIKPANLLICQGIAMNDHIKVLDFGLIKQVQSDQQDQALTRVNSITGTPMYMSPEAVRDAGTIRESSDLYSVGAVGYTLLTGLPIFDGDGSVDICMKQLHEVPIRPSERCGQTLPDDLQNVLMSCLRKTSEERPASADDLAMMLRSCQDFGSWDEGDALQWWDVDYPAHLAHTHSSRSPSTSVRTRDGTRTKS